ncbi:MAG: hypothetical protein IJ801_10560 [Lachnospiraceae bacterium]|nr:hypothetical protein [Lachnospiraceae bacterium]
MIVVILLWVPLMFLLLPAHWIQKRVHTGRRRETIRTVILRALTISVLITFMIGSGLIAMYFDHYFGLIR